MCKQLTAHICESLHGGAHSAYHVYQESTALMDLYHLLLSHFQHLGEAINAHQMELKDGFSDGCYLNRDLLGPEGF